MTTRHIGTAAVAMVLLASLGACSKQGGATAEQAVQPPAQPTAAARDDAPYHTEMPLNEFMPHVMQYAGDGVWKWQGWKIDTKGEHSLFPKSDADWEQAESGARTLAEVTNLLLLPGRRIAEPEWDNAVAQVYKIALRAAAAAEKHDEKAFFDAGGDLDEACDVCHVRYDPTFKRAG
jgi:hypothetical protein